MVRVSAVRVSPLRSLLRLRLKPLLLLHITQGLAGDEVNTAHYRHHLELAEGAEATVIEHYVSLSELRHFTGARLTMNVAANAHLRHIKLAFENPVSHHFAHNDIQLGADATAETVIAACTSLRTAQASAPDPAKFVPIEALRPTVRARIEAEMVRVF